MEYLAPKLGHTQAGTIPDEPYREWSYENYNGKYFDISNSERALNAAQNCYLVMTRFLSKQSGMALNPPSNWHDIAPKFSKLFEIKGNLSKRVKAWKSAIAGGGFGFKPTGMDQKLNYNEKKDRKWFNAAVKVTKNADGKDEYFRKLGFETSHWKYFHDAAAYHRFTVMHEVLPEYGMICG